jgi:hypothetical protein
VFNGVSIFAIGVPTNSDQIRVSGLTVAPIPLPAAGWLLLAGVGGLVAMRRKKAA